VVAGRWRPSTAYVGTIPSDCWIVGEYGW
jgi:hypothetical protein